MADEKISLLPLAVTPLNPDLFVIVNSGVTSRITWASILAALPSGSGTVTSVAWTTSQGVSASISNSTTTPNITVTLGALTGVTSLNGLVITPNTGVVTTGTWNASLITGQYGGTGVANTGKTITLGGNLVTSGAFDTTFSASATATYTLPTATSTLLANSLGLSGSTTLIGGTTVGGSLSLQSTSAAGTTDFIRFLVGNNGATEAARFINNGNLLIGKTTSLGTNYALEIERTVTDTLQGRVKNASTVNGAYAQFSVANSATFVNLGLVGTSTTTSGEYVQAQAYNITNSAGWSFGTNNASGVIRFYSGSAVLRATFGSAGALTFSAGSATAGSAPIKLTSGTVNTSAEAGALEFTTDSLFFTGTTGTTRKTLSDYSYRGISALRTLDGSDELVNITSGTFTVTLPTAVGYTKNYIIKNSGTGIITLATTSSQTIDGFASGVWTLNTLDKITIRSDGANWIRTN